MSENPPFYAGVKGSPPHYTLPETFSIRHFRVPLFVKPQQLKGHLSMLHAFHNLRVVVESNSISRFPDDIRAMEPEKRWGWFVNIAVERFDRWCHNLDKWDFANLELALPPVDVLMVWHTYLLNPIWYAEDTRRISTLSHLPVLTKYLAANIASPDLLITNSPHPDRVHKWEHHTSTPYDPFDAAAALLQKLIQCPHCERWTYAPFIGPSGSGYAQSAFIADCTACGKTIWKDLLGLLKFANDIVQIEGFLPGTLHTPYLRRDTSRAALVKKNIMVAARLPVSNKLTAHGVMRELKFDPTLLTRILCEHINGRIGRRILSAYTDDRPFSVELVGAVLRQASFVGKMANLGWTDPSFFSDEEEMVVLQHCVARYHAFLGLIADSPKSFFVPTLDIDLAWHTHQLMGIRYHAECGRVVGRYIDHDDRVEENHLATAFDVTCRAWTDRYGLPYTYCGCPLPGTTLGQRLRNALALHPFCSTSKRDVPQPPRDAAPGTHASDHNAVYPMHNRGASELARKRRRQRAERRQRRDLDGEKDKSAVLPYDRRQAETHELAFFNPVPTFISNASCVCVPFVVGKGTCATGLGDCMAACTGGACGGSGGGCGGGGCGGGGCGGG